MNKPTLLPNETLAAYFDRLKVWEDQGEWIPGTGEEKFRTRSGAILQYCWQPRSGKKAYLDCGTDLILTDAEANNLLQRA